MGSRRRRGKDKSQLDQPFCTFKTSHSGDISLFESQSSQKVECHFDADVSNACGPWFESHDRTFSRFFFPLIRQPLLSTRVRTRDPSPLIPYESLRANVKEVAVGGSLASELYRCACPLRSGLFCYPYLPRARHSPPSTCHSDRNPRHNRHHHNDRNTITSFHQNPRGVLLHRTSSKYLISTHPKPKS